MGDVVRLHALDGVEELRVLTSGSERRLERGAMAGTYVLLLP